MPWYANKVTLRWHWSLSDPAPSCESQGLHWSPPEMWLLKPLHRLAWGKGLYDWPVRGPDFSDHWTSSTLLSLSVPTWPSSLHQCCPPGLHSWETSQWTRFKRQSLFTRPGSSSEPAQHVLTDWLLPTGWGNKPRIFKSQILYGHQQPSTSQPAGQTKVKGTAQILLVRKNTRTRSQVVYTFNTFSANAGCTRSPYLCISIQM